MRKKTAEKSQLGIITGQTTDILTPAGLKGRLHVRSQLRVQMFALSDLRNIFKTSSYLQDKYCCNYKRLLIYRVCKVLTTCLNPSVTSLFT